MTTKLISNAIRDIIPTHPEPYPKELISYSSSLYSSSKTRNCILKNQYEIARYHICVYLTIEKFEKRLDLPEPIVDKIPIPRNLIRKTVLEFKKKLNLNNNITNVNSLPSPRKIAILEKIKENSKKSNDISGIGSLMTPPTKRIRKLSDIESDDDISDEDYSSDDSYTPRKKTNKLQLITPNSSPSKNLKLKLQSSSVKPKKRQIKKLTTSTTTTTTTTTNNISTPLLISFCNRFNIPSDITKSILKTYTNYYNRIKNPWGLLCGLVSVVYFKLNKDEIDNKLGFKIEFLLNLQKQQNGGLSKLDLQKWIKLINNLINSEKWFRDLDISSINNKIEIPISLNSSTSMIDFNTMYFSPIYNQEFENWCKLYKF